MNSAYKVYQMKKWIFLLILLVGAYEDYRSRTLTERYLLVAGGAGSLCAAVSLIKNGGWADAACSVGIGAALLGFSFVTDGGIGEGDGWFFVISGMFLTWKENLLMLCAGWCFCFLYCLVLVGCSIGRISKKQPKSIPFLPFLVPVGIYLTFFGG